MKKNLTFFAFLFFQIVVFSNLFAQNKAVLGELTVEKIMRDPKWIGIAPNNVFWSENSQTVYFEWNPEKENSTSLYSVAATGGKPVKISKEANLLLPPASAVYSPNRLQKIFSRNGDLFVFDISTNKLRQLTNTVEDEARPKFVDNQLVSFEKNTNLFTLHLQTGVLTQLTDFQKGAKPSVSKPEEQRKWLENQQLELLQILKEKKEKEKEAESKRKEDAVKRPLKIYVQEKIVNNLQLSPDQNFVTYRLLRSATQAKTAIVPNYVTETGYTEDLQTRSKVGDQQWSYEFWIYDLQKDTTYTLDYEQVAGIYDEPAYFKDYNRKAAKPTKREIVPNGVIYSEDGKNAIVVLRAIDSKDRWIMALDFKTNKLRLIDRQHEDTWIGGPGIDSWHGSTGNIGFVDKQTLWFQSEETGFSHLYTYNLTTNQKTALTQGKFEVRDVVLSKDKKNWYLTTSETHPGEDHFYKMTVLGGKMQKITSLIGGNEVVLSPDEKRLAILYSYSNKPTEFFVAENKENTVYQQVTNSTSEEFKSYSWRDPQIVSFQATDGTEIFARLYKPQNPNGAGVIFVHGAGYLQNAHKHWSTYFREYMFHNLLADKGFTVLDIDYRASAGYGREVRTGIYRYMGGKDLDDQVDGAKYLAEKHGIDAKRMGIYGGSYGGFITLMALFTKPDVFKAGAALRSVTDWAHYNHGYTQNILNTPVLDSIAYRRSSPIYFAEGLKNNLLMCHGMVDTNVHFQDVVRLSQRLIELKKDHWEMAIYPVEDHGFREPSSWADEYKRILKLFETHLLK